MPNHSQVPDGWRVVRLGDVCASPQYGAAARSRPFERQLPRYVRITDITDDGRLRTEGARSANPAQVTGYELKPGDLLFARSGATVGKTYLYRSEDGPCVYAGYLIRFRPCRKTVVPEYLDWITHSQHYHRWVASMLRAGAQPNINAAEYSSLRFSLPPLPEQRAIAGVLDAIDEAIERTEAVIAATERLRDSLLHELLTRGVPGWHSEWKEVAGVGTVPACWEVVRLGEVATVRTGQIDPTEQEFQEYSFIGPDDIESGTGRLINSRTVAEARVISGKYQFDKGDALYCKIRPYLMKVHVPNEPGVCSADIYPLRSHSMLEPGYLALVLLSRSLTAYTRTCSDRTGIPKINRVDLVKYRFVLPHLTEQRAIAGSVAAINKAIESGRAERKRLEAMKASAADALLTGRLRTQSVENGK